MYRIEEFPGFPNSHLSMEMNPWGEYVFKWDGEEDEVSYFLSCEDGFGVISTNRDNKNGNNNKGNSNSDT